MSVALKVFVCGFSFLFSAYFCYAFFALFFYPIKREIEVAGHPHLAFALSLVPPALALHAGYRAARVALDLERQRQDRVRVGQR